MEGVAWGERPAGSGVEGAAWRSVEIAFTPAEHVRSKTHRSDTCDAHLRRSNCGLLAARGDTSAWRIRPLDIDKPAIPQLRKLLSANAGRVVELAKSLDKSDCLEGKLTRAGFRKVLRRMQVENVEVDEANELFDSWDIGEASDLSRPPVTSPSRHPSHRMTPPVLSTHTLPCCHLHTAPTALSQPRLTNPPTPLTPGSLIALRRR